MVVKPAFLRNCTFKIASHLFFPGRFGQVLSLTRVEQENNNNTRQTSSLKTMMAQGWGLNANFNSSLFFVLACLWHTVVNREEKL